MQDVYKQGFLNVAASTATDARGGLFKPRSSLAFQPVHLYMPGVDETFYLTVDYRNMFRWTETDPLSRRAWVFQERHLARRILHFTRTEIFWECCAKAPYFASETFTKGAPLDAVLNSLPKLQSASVLKQSNPSVEEVHDLWEDLCQMYSEKDLTYHRDKLVALSGLAKEFQNLLPEDKYIAGMWGLTMPQSLFWEIPERYGPEPVSRLDDVAPSCSWAFIDDPLQKKFRYKDAQKKIVSVADVKPDLVLNETPEPSTSKLVLSAYIRRVTIKDNLVEDGFFPHQTFNNKKQLLVHQGSQQLTVGDSQFSYIPAVAYTLDNNIESKVTEA
ncbi:MAG: hypothetical protein LQ350_008632 [Teloschistes chrysophthalmus]|nr:MAG: hypothetical protein LQ350_008632 [Niorma chrysophthalma]